MPKTLEKTLCYHCGESCPPAPVMLDEKPFCCEGCKTVYEILESHQLCNYYDISEFPGTRIGSVEDTEEYAYLDLEEIQEKIIDYKDDNLIRVRFNLPQIHCASCIWLLENLYKLRDGILNSQVNFLRKEISLSFSQEEISLRQVVQLLASLGYAPDIRLQDLDRKQTKHNNKAFYLKLGVAGFCFGNIMLLSFPEYLSGDQGIATEFTQFFSILNVLLALPVFFYSSQPFFRSAWSGLKNKHLNIDVPVSLGIIALFSRSLWEIVVQGGPGYLDSLTGLVFFLLAGRWFQQHTYDQISFDRDYRSYFPLATIRMKGDKEERIALPDLRSGDRIRVRNQELVPADSTLLTDEAFIDYSFVTGEATPVKRVKGDLIYAGGKQTGPMIELLLNKEVSQSYLTQLWNESPEEDKILKGAKGILDKLAHNFTIAVLLIASLAGLYWMQTDSAMAVHVFTSVLIIACPCALALAIPITLGNILRLMGRAKFYVKHTDVLEQMAKLSHIVFDKTGTLTATSRAQVEWTAGLLTDLQKKLIKTLTNQSLHPISRSIHNSLQVEMLTNPDYIEELAGHGIRGTIEGYNLAIGSARWTGACRSEGDAEGARAYVSIDGECIGYYKVKHSLREGIRDMIKDLSKWTLSLVSGDNSSEEARIRHFVGEMPMHFNQKPKDKQQYIQSLQKEQARVMMVGDGLNDAGALRQSNVGIAVSEDVNYFTPACDGILDARNLKLLPQFLDFARYGVRMVYSAVAISLLYNLLGLSIAVQGLLSPVWAAILMPLSSVSVVIFGLASSWIGYARYVNSYISND